MADFDKVIPPGKEGKINTIIYGNQIHPGPFRKNYTVTTNDPENSRLILLVSGNVKKVFDISENFNITAFASESIDKKAVLTNLLKKPIRLVGYRWSERGKDYDAMKKLVGVELSEIEAGVKYELRVWNKGEIRAGNYIAGDLLLLTDDEDFEEKRIMVRIQVLNDIQVHPAKVILPEMRVEEGTSRSFDKTVTLVATRGDTLKVFRVIPSREDITVKLQPVKEGKSYRCSVRIRPPSESGAYEANLKFITNYSGYEEIDVPVKGSVRVMKKK